MDMSEILINLCILLPSFFTLYFGFIGLFMLKRKQGLFFPKEDGGVSSMYFELFLRRYYYKYKYSVHKSRTFPENYLKQVKFISSLFFGVGIFSVIVSIIFALYF